MEPFHLPAEPATNRATEHSPPDAIVPTTDPGYHSPLNTSVRPDSEVKKEPAVAVALEQKEGSEPTPSIGERLSKWWHNLEPRDRSSGTLWSVLALGEFTLAAITPFGTGSFFFHAGLCCLDVLFATSHFTTGTRARD